MKKNIRIILSIIGIIVLSCLSFYIIKNSLMKKVKTDNELINISELPEEFVNNYLDKVKEIKQEDRENILIVVSEKEIKLEDCFGAKKITKAPNNQYILQYNNTEDTKNALTKLKKNDSIVNVEENHIYKFSETTSSNTYNSWGVTSMGLDYASNLSNQHTSSKITVAIIDSGCDMELFNSSFNGKIEETANLYDNNNMMYDSFGHGTHIAGTIAEATPNNVKILPIKVSDDRTLDDVKIQAALNYIIYYEKADVVNMSFGASYNSQTEYDLIETAKSKNIISVAACGNSSVATCDYPALYDNTISIGAVDSLLNKAEFSSYGNGLDFVAPGVSIKSINGIYDGTSMATPHAVSAIAILKSFKKNITLDNTKNILKENSIDLGPDDYDAYFGNGYINFSSIKLCDDPSTQTCDDLNMFQAFEESSIKSINPVLTTYNYGSLTNILATEVELQSTNGDKKIKTLSSLEDVEISEYDPYSTEDQTINIKYKEMEKSFIITNPENYESGWIFDERYDNGVKSQMIIKYKDHGKKISKLYFPKTIDGNVVSHIADYHYYDGTTTKFTDIYEGSQDVEYYKEVYLPETIIYVGNCSFQSFKNLNKFESLSKSPIRLKSAALGSLKYLKEVIGNIKLEEYDTAVFSGDTLLENVTLSDANLVIPPQTFTGCQNLKSIILPSNLQSIGKGAFNGSGLETISFPNSLKIIDESAFLGSNLKSINLNLVTEVGKMAFFANPIETINIPSTLTKIGDGAFSMYTLKSITVNDNNQTYDSRDNSNAIIETSTNKLISGALNTTIPNTVKKIGSYAFYSTMIKELIIPEGVTTLEEASIIYNFDLEKLYLPNTINSIPEGMFNFFNTGSQSKYMSTILFVNNNSYSQTYALNNNLAYKIITDDITDELDSIEFVSLKNVYRAFEKATKNDFNIVINYKNKPDKEVINNKTFEIEYFTGEDSFRYEDSFYIVKFDANNGIKNLRVPVTNIEVLKATPEYTIPTGLTAQIGQTLSDIELPDGFSWMDETQTLNEDGNKVFKAKFTPDDITNYEIVENIDVNVIVGTPIISNTTTDFECIYDEKDHTISISVDIDNYIIKYSIDGQNYNLETIPKYSNVGEYTIYYKITADGYQDLTSSNKVKIYGIKELHSTLELKKNILIVKNQNNSFSNISSRITTFATSSNYIHNNKNNTLVNEDITKTSDKIKININNSKSFEYIVSILGDINSDGKITSGDYIKIRKYIMEPELITANEYFYAADINRDNQITSGDYIKIRKYIMNGGSL